MSQTPNSMPPIVVFDIDGVVRDVGGSYRRAIADTVEHFTDSAYRPTGEDLDRLKSEGIWNNDWEASQELVYRYFEAQGRQRTHISLDYDALVDFFQSRYRGANWDGYICSEPLLLQSSYLEQLTNAGIPWGFFSGAPRDEAIYVLSRLGLNSPVLVAMEDAPGKPDPTGLLATVRLLEVDPDPPNPPCQGGLIVDPPNPPCQGGLIVDPPNPPCQGGLIVDPPNPPCQGGLKTELSNPPGEGGLQSDSSITATPVIYAGDTVADMYTVEKARMQEPNRTWIGVGILPPHVQASPERKDAYAATLKQAGAAIVLDNVQQLTPERIMADFRF